MFENAEDPPPSGFVVWDFVPGGFFGAENAITTLQIMYSNNNHKSIFTMDASY